MRTQELFDDLMMEGYSMSENPLIASDLLLGSHAIRYGRHFEKYDGAQHKCTFQLVKVKLCVTNFMIFRVRDLFVMLDLISQDLVTSYAAIFQQENMKNYNLLITNWKLLNIFIIQQVFGVKKFIQDVNFAVQRPCDRIRCHFQSGKHEFLKNSSV